MKRDSADSELTSDFNIDEAIEQLPQLNNRSELLAPLKNIFHYTQFLLDNDDNLTRTGNLNSQAKQLLQSRIFEVLDIAMEAPSNNTDSIEAELETQ